MSKILKGLKRLKIFPILANTSTTYTPGAAISIPGSQTLALDPDVTEWKVPADDGTYEAGSDWNGMKMTLQLAELPIELKPYFEGGTWDATAKEYTFKSDALAPEIGMSFAALTSDGQYRMKRLYVMKCTKVKGDYKTKGEGDSTSPISLELTVTQRKIDNSVTKEKDTVTAADLVWLDTLADANDTSPPGGTLGAPKAGAATQIIFTFNEPLAASTLAITDRFNLLSSLSNDALGANTAIAIATLANSVQWLDATSANPKAIITIASTTFVAGQTVRLSFKANAVQDKAGVPNATPAATNFDAVVTA